MAVDLKEAVKRIEAESEGDIKEQLNDALRLKRVSSREIEVLLGELNKEWHEDANPQRRIKLKMLSDFKKRLEAAEGIRFEGVDNKNMQRLRTHLAAKGIRTQEEAIEHLRTEDNLSAINNTSIIRSLRGYMKKITGEIKQTERSAAGVARAGEQFDAKMEKVRLENMKKELLQTAGVPHAQMVTDPETKKELGEIEAKLAELQETGEATEKTNKKEEGELSAEEEEIADLKKQLSEGKLSADAKIKVRERLKVLENEKSEQEKQKNALPSMELYNKWSRGERKDARRLNKEKIRELRAKEKLTKEELEELKSRKKFHSESRWGKTKDVSGKAYGFTLSAGSVEGLIIFGIAVHLIQGLQSYWTEPHFALNAVFVIFIAFIILLSQESTSLKFSDMGAVIAIFFLEMQWFNIVRYLPITGWAGFIGIIFKSKFAFPLWVYFGLWKAGKLDVHPKFVTWTWRVVFIFWFFMFLSMANVYQGLELFKGEGLDKGEAAEARAGFAELTKEAFIPGSKEDKYAREKCSSENFMSSVGDQLNIKFIQNPAYIQCKTEVVIDMKRAELEKAEKEAVDNSLKDGEEKISVDIKSLPLSTEDLSNIEQVHIVVIKSPKDNVDVDFECTLKKGLKDKDDKDGQDASCTTDMPDEEALTNINELKETITIYDKVKETKDKYFEPGNNRFVFNTVIKNVDTKAKLPIIVTSKDIAEELSKGIDEDKKEKKKNWFKFWKEVAEKKDVPSLAHHLTYYKNSKIQTISDDKFVVADIQEPTAKYEENPLFGVDDGAKIKWLVDIFHNDEFKKMGGRIKKINNIELGLPSWVVADLEKCPFVKSGDKYVLDVSYLNQNLDTINDAKQKDTRLIRSCTTTVDFKRFSGYDTDEEFAQNTPRNNQIKLDWVKVNVNYDYEFVKKANVKINAPAP